MTHSEGWSWFDAPEMSELDFTGHDVTAVLVCRNAGGWLNATLAGLGQLDRRPEVIIAIDNASKDDTPELLSAAHAAGLVDHLVRGEANFSFGEAVERALSVVPAPTRWVWLLHDDAIPDPACLTELLTLAARTPRLAIAVPLLVRPFRRHHAARTLEIGATISSTGQRYLGLEPDEVAQGQYESVSVLGGSTCGMLVNRESMQEFGGFDPAIPGYRDGVDIGWRAQLIDHWVMTCPRARMVHRQAGHSEIRQGTAAGRAKRSEAAWDRLMGLRLVTAHVRGIARIPNTIYLSFVCWLNALAYVLGRAPDKAKDELNAWADYFFRSHKAIKGLRRKIKQVSQGVNTRYRVRALRPTLGNALEARFQSIARWFQEQFASGADGEMTLDDLLGDEFTRRLGEGRKRIPGGVWFAAGLAGLALMARGLYRTGLVTAQSLMGAPSSLSQGFQRALSSAGQAEPWLLVSAAFSALSVRPQWLPAVLLVLSFPVTLIIGVWYGRRRIRHGGVRWLAASCYALLPILMGGLNRGALWLVVLAWLVPFLAEWLSRLDNPWQGARSLQSIAGICLSGVLLVAIMPALWVPVMVLGVWLAIRSGALAQILLVATALVLPLAFWAGAFPSYFKNPSRLLLTPESMLTPAPLTWQALFGRPLNVGLPPLWLSLAVFSALWLGVVVVFVLDSKLRWPVLAGIGAIAVGMWMGRLTLHLGTDQVRVDPTPWLIVGFGVLVFALVSWLDSALGSLEGRDFGGFQALLAILSLFLVGSFVLAASWSAYAGLSQVHRGPSQTLPEFLSQNERELGSATLVIDAGNSTWYLRSGGQTMWGQGSFRDGPAASETATGVIQQIVARAVAARPDDSITTQLASLGVAAVVVDNATADMVTALDTTAGLQRATATGLQIWMVTADAQSPTTRALVGTGSPPVYLGPHDDVGPDSPRTLVLATPADPAMHVFVGGAEVPPTRSNDWRAAYALGNTSGQITITHSIDNSWIAWVQLGVVALLIIFVVPPMRPEEDDADKPRYQLRGTR